jgi:hypothetical protein
MGLQPPANGDTLASNNALDYRDRARSVRSPRLGSCEVPMRSDGDLFPPAIGRTKLGPACGDEPAASHLTSWASYRSWPGVPHGVGPEPGEYVVRVQ